eukprot:15464995-Alexandrium_andersonii.AAC.1
MLLQGWDEAVQQALWQPLAAWLQGRSIEALAAPPSAAGWDAEIATWLLDGAGAAAWLTAEPGEAAEGLAAVGFVDQRVQRPMARWRLGRAALEAGEREWASAGQA